jgi:hypothetical protein
LRVDLNRDGAAWTLDSSIANWVKTLPIGAASAVSSALEEAPHAADATTLVLSATTIASWPEATCVALGLPRNSPLAFDVRLTGVMGKPGASLAVRFLQPGKTLSAKDVTVEGPWLQWEGKTYRVPNPVFDTLGLIESFNRTGPETIEEQFRAWARIRELLGDTDASRLTDGFLRSFRVVTASSLTFSITSDERGDIQIDPVLLTDRRAADGEDREHVRALTESDEGLFPKRLDQLRSGAPAFPLAQGTYVVVDEALQQALTAVRTLRQSSPESRKRAAMHPEAVIRELLGQDDDEPSAFVETERFAERVLDVAEWTPPVVPWIKIPPQDWAPPTAFGVRLNGVEVPMQAEELAKATAAMREAVAKGEPSITINGAVVPATPANVHALEQLERALEDRSKPPAERKAQDPATQKVLIIETNFDDASFTRVQVGKRPGTPTLPGGLKTTPKPHQETGIRWLQEHWIAGTKGAMLCDDMGLGKTFQALAFCQWLREAMECGQLARKPILIVAPVGLLRNWENEIGDHLLDPGLGALVRAYGEHLRGLRRGQHADGTASLDTARLAGGDVVLANYEAVSDYQLSFGAVPFAACVLDEAQKIKSPKARMTHAVKGLNVDFVVAMTGTPVENRLADLWCIADAVQPGGLSDLREFSARYESADADVQALRSSIWQDDSSTDFNPLRLLLRRLKTDKLDGLPPKHEHVIRAPMPQAQADAYGRALAMKELAGPEGTLGMIHALRRISLHPLLVEDGLKLGEELRVEDSARLAATISTLDQIKKAGEKALVFLESLDLQDADQLPMLLQRRYDLPRLPMVINGEVSTEARQQRVRTFQQESGFDVMLLSPKAGGVGLTLTAANHVIHLSRWWNPAVEDQCSDRVYRIGQTKPVHIYYPLAILPDAEESSFDVQLQMLMDRKRELARNLLVAPAFTKSDYEKLLAGTRPQ